MSNELQLEFAIGGHSLCAEFQRLDDRYRHRLLVSVAGQFVAILESVETDEPGCSPPSPPLQHLVRQETPNGAAILGTGAAGRQHWSASFEPKANNSLPAIHAGVACRVNEHLTWCGSAYRLISDEWALEQADHGLAICIPGCRLLVAGIAETRVDLHRENQQIRIAPAETPPRLPQTVQWEYQFAVLPKKGSGGLAQ